MNESDLTQSLDERDLLADARGPGVYALTCDVPTGDPDAILSQWDATHDHRPGDDRLRRLVGANPVLYVGASGQVYDRLCDHAAGDVRTTAFCAAFEPTGVVDVWPHDDPFAHERRRAIQLARDGGWVVWCDGEVWG